MSSNGYSLGYTEDHADRTGSRSSQNAKKKQGRPSNSKDQGIGYKGDPPPAYPTSSKTRQTMSAQSSLAYDNK
ncbi:NADP oxidoreductase [Sesbania bispinosa]|nr:NADP oxidoreductase [Sesbania bispinosa]